MPRISVNDSGNYQSSLNGEWFSLKNDKDVARVQFMMDNLDDLDVFACHKVKIGDKERYVDCLRTYDEPIDKCPFCAAGIPVKPVRFVLMYQHDDSKVKIWERGKNFIAKLQSLCNRYQPLSQEGVIASQPDLVVISRESVRAMGGEASLWALPGLAQTPAGRNKQVLQVDDMALLGFSVRTPQAILQLRAKAEQLP